MFGDTAEDFVRHGLDVGRDNVQIIVSESPECKADDGPASALVVGAVEDGCLVRIHSRCLYAEVFGSRECDCGVQLSQAKKMIHDAGSGVLIYLDQEGRGAGLLAKARAYRMTEETNSDTYSSYDNLCLPRDPRTYEAAVCILSELGLTRVSLLTNNPRKIEALEQAGVSVDRVPLIVRSSEHADAYLLAKKNYGHLL